MRQSDAIVGAMLALLAGGVAGCNNTKLAPAPIETPPPPTPTPTPAADDPIAVINGGSPSYATLATAAFDGSASYDPAGGTITSYAWSMIDAPSGSASNPTPSGTNGDQVSFFCDVAGNYTIQLVVTNQAGHTGTAVYTFAAVPSDDLHVELTWVNQYTKADMDLHLVNRSQAATPPKMWNATYDCHWENCQTQFGEVLNWWAAGTADNARLDIDNISETTPENINIATPHDGTYRIEVHYYSDHTGSVPTLHVDNTVNVYIGGALVYTATKTLTNVDDVWVVGDVVWSGGTGTVTPLGSVVSCGFAGAAGCM